MITINQLEFKKMVEDAVVSAMEKVSNETKREQNGRVEKKYIHSIKELADLLKCSVATAQKYKNEGKIPYKQINRKLYFDVDEVMNAIKTIK